MKGEFTQIQDTDASSSTALSGQFNEDQVCTTIQWLPNECLWQRVTQWVGIQLLPPPPAPPPPPPPPPMTVAMTGYETVATIQWL